MRRSRATRYAISFCEGDDRVDGDSLVRTNVSAADLDTVGRQLSPDEQIEWVGRPNATKHLMRGDLYLVPFSILWACFAIFWETSAITNGAGLFFALWGIPFIVIGLYFVVGRFFYKADRKRRTLYAVTNRRVMSIVQRSSGEGVEATYLRAILNISTSAASDGRGSVVFGNSSPLGGWYANTGMEILARGSFANTGVSFYDVDDPRGVADLVERLRARG